MLPGKLCRKRLVDQLRHGNPHRAGLCNVGVSYGICEPRALEHEVKAIGTERIELSEIKLLQDVEQHQCGQSLRVGRQLENVQAAIVGGDRGDDFAAMPRKIFHREERAAAREGRHHVLGHRAFVKTLWTLRCDRAQGLGERGELDDIPLRGGLVVPQIMAAGTSIGPQLCHLLRPVPCDARCDGKSLLGVMGGGRQCAIEA